MSDNRRLIVILNGSPSPAGHTMTLADRITGVCGGKAIVVHAYDSGIRPCGDCRHCLGRKACAIDDGMTDLRPLLERADAVLLASPLHFCSLTAPLVAIISRLQPYWNARMRGEDAGMRPKLGMVALTGGGRTRDMFAAGRQVAGAVFHALNARFAGMVEAANTDVLPVSSNREALDKAEAVGRRVASLLAASDAAVDGMKGE